MSSQSSLPTCDFPRACQLRMRNKAKKHQDCRILALVAVTRPLSELKVTRTGDKDRASLTARKPFDPYYSFRQKDRSSNKRDTTRQRRPGNAFTHSAPALRLSCPHGPLIHAGKLYVPRVPAMREYPTNVFLNQFVLPTAHSFTKWPPQGARLTSSVCGITTLAGEGSH